jgi:dienelactone hydrolase
MAFFIFVIPTVLRPMLTTARGLFLGLWFISILGCSLTRPYPQGKIEEDAHLGINNELAGLGPLPISIYQARIKGSSVDMHLLVYQPSRYVLGSPGVVLLPGVMASDDQYESYARALASRGFVVALRDWYSYFLDDTDLAKDGLLIKEWLKSEKRVDPKRIAILGHSMGAKDAMLAGLMDPSFSAIVAIDPDNQGDPSVATPALLSLKPPLFLIGAEVSWKGPDFCAPKNQNYEVFYHFAPAGTLELTLKDADHVQMLDDPDRFGYSFCRVGLANSDATRILTRSAVVAYLTGPLQAASSRLNHLLPGDQFRIKTDREVVNSSRN